MGRAPCCDKANVKRGPWSPEEDDKLKSYIEKHGTGGNWIALPHKIGLKRCGKSCRLRWLNYLRPNIKHGSFTEDEDNLIYGLYIAIGSRWSIIAAQLPGRTDNDIKNYWNTKLKKKLLGRQRKQKQIKKAEAEKGDQIYATNVCIGLYPQLPQLMLPPCLVQSQYSNSITNFGLIPPVPVDERFVHDHPLPNNNSGKVGNTVYTSDSDSACFQNQQLRNNSMAMLDPSTPLLGSDLFGAYDVFAPLPLKLDRSTMELMSCRTSFLSPEITASWGDATSTLQSCVLSDEEVVHRIIPKNWEFACDSRVIGYME